MIEKYSVRTDLALEQKERFESDNVEVPGVVLEEDYDEEREGFESDKSFEGPKFTLVYLNDDEIPELAIVDDWRHGDGVGYYIYADGEVVFIGEYGQYGGNRYVEKESIIFGEYDGAEAAHYWIYRIDGTKEILLQSRDLYIHWDSEYEDPEYTYIVDEKEVAEEEYMAACAMWDNYEEKVVAYDRCFMMMDGSIKENLNKAMEELYARRYERRWKQ